MEEVKNDFITNRDLLVNETKKVINNISELSKKNAFQLSKVISLIENDTDSDSSNKELKMLNNLNIGLMQEGLSCMYVSKGIDKFKSKDKKMRFLLELLKELSERIGVDLDDNYYEYMEIIREYLQGKNPRHALEEFKDDLRDLQKKQRLENETSSNIKMMSKALNALTKRSDKLFKKGKDDLISFDDSINSDIKESIDKINTTSITFNKDVELGSLTQLKGKDKRNSLLLPFVSLSNLIQKDYIVKINEDKEYISLLRYIDREMKKDQFLKVKLISSPLNVRMKKFNEYKKLIITDLVNSLFIDKDDKLLIDDDIELDDISKDAINYLLECNGLTVDFSTLKITRCNELDNEEIERNLRVNEDDCNELVLADVDLEEGLALSLKEYKLLNQIKTKLTNAKELINTDSESLDKESLIKSLEYFSSLYSYKEDSFVKSIRSREELAFLDSKIQLCKNISKLVNSLNTDDLINDTSKINSLIDLINANIDSISKDYKKSYDLRPILTKKVVKNKPNKVNTITKTVKRRNKNNSNSLDL